jgi:hypothetical protein
VRPECAHRFLPWSKCRAERQSVTKLQKDSSDIPLDEVKSLNHKKSLLESEGQQRFESPVALARYPLCGP